MPRSKSMIMSQAFSISPRSRLSLAASASVAAACRARSKRTCRTRRRASQAAVTARNSRAVAAPDHPATVRTGARISRMSRLAMTNQSLSGIRSMWASTASPR